MHEASLFATLTLKDDRVGFDATDGTRAPVRVDGLPPLGHGEGTAPMQMFLEAYAGCMAITLASMLRDRMRATIVSMNIAAQGTLLTRHPKAFSRIALHMTLVSPGLTEEAVRRAIDAAEEKVCPISAMIRGNVATRVTFTLHADAPA